MSKADYVQCRTCSTDIEIISLISCSLPSYSPKMFSRPATISEQCICRMPLIPFGPASPQKEAHALPRPLTRHCLRWQKIPHAMALAFQSHSYLTPCSKAHGGPVRPAHVPPRAVLGRRGVLDGPGWRSLGEKVKMRSLLVMTNDFLQRADTLYRCGGIRLVIAVNRAFCMSYRRI